MAKGGVTSLTAFAVDLMGTYEPPKKEMPYSQHGKLASRAMSAAWSILARAGTAPIWLSVYHVAAANSTITERHRPTVPGTAVSVQRSAPWSPLFSG